MLNMRPKYQCKRCDYECSKKHLWTQHLSTLKHKRQRPATKFVCEICGKIYKQRSGLWRHKKKCLIDEEDYVENDENVVIHEGARKLEKENTELKNLMKHLITGLNKDANVKDEMMGQLKEQSKIIQDMIPRMGSNNNNRFNINVFLNEQCKDAINMSDFIESLQIQIEDLRYAKNNGLIEGISSVFVNGLKQLDTFKRPIHCTDMKRETLYIKDNDEWENGKGRLRSAISDVANKERKAILEWEAENPSWAETEHGKDDYINLVKSVMADVSQPPDENKIIKTIAKETIIDKDTCVDK